MIRPSLRLAALLALLLALAGSLALYPVRRRVVVAYLHLGDWLAPSAPRRDRGGELLVFDATAPEDRAALGRGHGQLSWRDAGSALELSGSALPGEHELCTRRIPRDWSPHRVLRLELEGASLPRGSADRAARPLHLTLRVRGRPGWGHTAWYWQRVYLDRAARSGAALTAAPPGRANPPGPPRSWEVGLTAADRSIDRRGVRQLCLSLRGEPGAAAPVLRLRRILLGDRFSAERPPSLPRTAPLRVALLADGHKLRRFDDPPLPASSAVRLQAARNEVVAIQIAIARRASGPAVATLSVEPLAGPAGPQPTLKLLRARYLIVRETSSSMYGTGLGPPGHYPDPLEPLGDMPIRFRLGPGNELFWLDLGVPEDATPGRYRGAISVALDGEAPIRGGLDGRPPRRSESVGAPRIRRELELEVWPVTLPHRRKLVMIYYLPALLREASGLAEGAESLRLELAAHRLVHAHGAFLAATPALDKLPRYRPALDGSLFALGPGRGEGAPYWPVDLMAEGPEATARAASQVVRWFAANAPATVPFVYLADEPSTRADYESIARRARWIKSAPEPGRRLAVMITEREKHEGDPGWPELRGLVDVWISPLNFPEPARRRRGGSERFFTYNGVEPLAGSQLLDASGISLRTWGWIAYLHGIDLWFLWQGAYYRDLYNGGAPLRPHLDAVSFDKRRSGKEDFGNGDGVIFYPPLRPGGPLLGSLRLKAIRRGVQDRLLLQLANRCGRGHHARRIARQLIPASLGEALLGTTSWPSDPEAWERARLELLRLVAGCR